MGTLSFAVFEGVGFDGWLRLQSAAIMLGRAPDPDIAIYC
jgi:hypothetical protein